MLAESTAITEYLDNLDGDPVLTFRHPTPGPCAALQAFKSPEWAGRQAWGEREGRRAIDGIRYVDGVLNGAPVRHRGRPWSKNGNARSRS